jgi:two-component system, OmpR family, sensor kinase
MALQYALSLTAIILTIGAVALTLDERQEHAQATLAGHTAWAGPVQLNDPPTNIWFVIREADGTRIATAAAPPGVRRLDPGALPDGPVGLTRDGHELVVWTGTRGVGRISAVYDLAPREAEEEPLLISLGIASIVGVAVATVFGGVLGRRAVRPLGTAIALQRRFVADASHELRTPLAVLMLRAEMLRERLPDPPGPELETEMNRLVHDASMLSEVVDDLLMSVDLARRPQDGVSVDLWTLAGEAADDLRPVADQRAVTLIATRTDSPDTEPPAVRGAPAALRRAVVSLVDNAIAHTPEGGHVRIEIGRRDAQLTICVRDDGEGLDPADADRLMQRFARGTTSDRSRRFGLGLALVAEVARAHGGDLEVDGRPGGGAALTVVLPRRDGTQPDQR